MDFWDAVLSGPSGWFWSQFKRPEKLEQGSNLRLKNRLLKGRPIYSGNWDTWFRLTCCAYLCSNPTGRKMAKMALFGDFEFLREVRVVMENVGK